jgi:hypothetical protein
MTSNTPHTTVQLPNPRRDADDADTGAVNPRVEERERGNVRWWHVWRLFRLARRAFRWAIIAAVVIALIVVVGIVATVSHLSNPFGAKTTDRSQPVLLLSMQDLARFDAASGNFQVVVDVKNDRSHIPDFLLSQRYLFVAAGSVEAYVDFAKLGPADVVTSADRRTATLRLPAPQLAPATLDVAHSYVYSESRGLINRLQDLVSSNPGQQSALYQLAQQKITAAAVGSQLAQRAQANTTSMLKELLKSLGFTTVTITYPSP